MIAEMESINASANKLITDHLDRYVRRMGTDATYEGWIGVLHPENVSLDSRLLLEGSAHQRMWKERVSTRDGTPSDFWQELGRLTSHRVRGVTEGLSAGLAHRPQPEATGRAQGCGASQSSSARGSVGRGETAPSTDGEAAAPVATASESAAAGCGEGGPLDGSDMRTLDQACGEVARLRRLVTQLARPRSDAAAAAATGGRRPGSASPTPLDALLRAIGGGGAGRGGGAVPSAAAPATARTTPTPPSSSSVVVGVDEAFGDLFARQERRVTTAEAAPSGRRGTDPTHSPVDELVAGLWGGTDARSQSMPGNPFGESAAAPGPGNPFGDDRPSPCSSPNLGTGGCAAAAANPFDV